jgi:hypothetical protein
LLHGGRGVFCKTVTTFDLAEEAGAPKWTVFPIPFDICYISNGVSETFTARTVRNGHENLCQWWRCVAPRDSLLQLNVDWSICLPSIQSFQLFFSNDCVWVLSAAW